MVDYLVRRCSYDKMPDFTILLGVRKLKVKITFKEQLTISIKEEDEQLFRELADIEQIELQSLQ